MLVTRASHSSPETRTAPRSVRSRDRRRATRVPARGVASHIQTMDASMPGLAVENVSMGGLFVRSARPLDPGTRVMLQIVRPGLKRAIQTTGYVVSSISAADARELAAVAGMGIRLDGLDADTEQRLAALVHDLAAVDAAAKKAATRTAAAPPAGPADEIARLREALAARERRIGELEAEVAALRGEARMRSRAA